MLLRDRGPSTITITISSLHVIDPPQRNRCEGRRGVPARVVSDDRDQGRYMSSIRHRPSARANRTNPAHVYS
ncbi:MAG: hypothetical protein ACRDU4_01495, partial [Mycobacterium sp.]